MSDNPTSGQTPTRRSESPPAPRITASGTPLFAIYPRFYAAANTQRYERAAVLIYLESSLRRVDRDVRFRAPDRGAARPTDPSRPYPGTERSELPPQPQPRAKQGLDDLICASPPAGNCTRATPSLRFRLTPPPASSRPPRTISPRRPRWQCFAPPFGLVSLRP